MARTCKLLFGSDRQITNICYEVGYIDVANFDHRFRDPKPVVPRDSRSEGRIPVQGRFRAGGNLLQSGR